MRTLLKTLLLLSPSGAAAPSPTYQSIVLGTQSAHLIAYFPLNETSGTVADDLSGVSGDGAYSGVTLNATTFLNGDPALSLDGINDYVNLYTPGISNNFDGQTGTVLLWAKVRWRNLGRCGGSIQSLLQRRSAWKHANNAG